ncbi:hypothetical protein SD71_14490 [Cohnella kolymensis]|uniref:Uncharacterized protein n=1 Tax=Cohnella kolymensis TaxID=1590652 RepID=A0ABR5A2G3_9BACL|nr:hypothetical protein [Cohnella kolymensis]KIL35249.1 hypothetical protein SD71_14490 [Cohnella kolymensis]
MRTVDQIKRKYNELAAQKQTFENRASSTDPSEQQALQSQIARLEEQMLLLEWVLNAPIGSYHS